jgi:hypothetical protein
VLRSERLHVTSPRGRRGSGRLTTHRAALPPHHVTTRDGLPVTTVARTVLDLAEVLDRPRLERVWEAADRLQLLDVAAVRRVMADCPGRRGLRPLGALLAPPLRRRPGHATGPRAGVPRGLRGSRHPRAGGERRGRRPLRGLPVAGHRLVAEIDSWRYHRARDAFDRDRDRDVDLALAGRVVARFTDRMLAREPAPVAARVEALLAATAPDRAATAPGAP